MNISIAGEDSSLLIVRHRPNQALLEAGLVVCSILTVISIFQRTISVAVPGALGLLLLVVLLARNYRIECTIDKRSDTLKYSDGGLFGYSLFRREMQRRPTDVRKVEMARVVTRFGDSFQVRLVMLDGERIALTPFILKFSECTQIAGQVNEFLLLSQPPTASDKLGPWKQGDRGI